nr:hypothetical protein [Allomuricauda sp.]
MGKQLFLWCSLLVLGASHSVAQEAAIGVSLQAYPAGFIPTLNFEHPLHENTSLLFRLGANFTDRKDFSDVNISEEGDGFGGSVGFRKHFPSGTGKFVAGLNMDVWSMNIDWTDLGPADAPFSGSTYILVLQPWLEGGYFLPFKTSKSQIGLTLGFGRELNVVTSGEEVAQGFIGSISLQYMISL